MVADRRLMSVSQLLVGLTLAASPGFGLGETLRFVGQADVNTLDPHGLNGTFTLGYQRNVDEGLTRRGPNLSIEPALTTSWEMIEPRRWRFKLREGVTLHDGSAFTADDVAFLAERVKADGSDLKSRPAGVVVVIAVDDHTVDFVTEQPNPSLNAEWATWYIMDREWALANDTVAATNIADQTGSFAHAHANGTGPFNIQTREADIKTVAVLNEARWDTPEHNLTEDMFQPINSDSTRIAALLSGEMDMVYPVPTQDVPRLEATDGVRALIGPELRTIFLGLDHERDELLHWWIKGANPFKDQRVRLAMYQAIDMAAIVERIMRGQATATAAIVAQGVQGFPEGLERHSFDTEAAKALLDEVGYPDGFSVMRDCPNDRYVNDEAICQAIVGMLGWIGPEVDLLAQSRSVYFAKVLAQGGNDTSFCMLSWTPGSFDSRNVLYNLVHSRTDHGARAFNLGGYANREIDELTAKILMETDLVTRAAMIQQAWQILHDDAGYPPLHQQALAWGVAGGFEVTQRADDQFGAMW